MQTVYQQRYGSSSSSSRLLHKYIDVSARKRRERKKERSRINKPFLKTDRIGEEEDVTYTLHHVPYMNHIYVHTYVIQYIQYLPSRLDICLFPDIIPLAILASNQ